MASDEEKQKLLKKLRGKRTVLRTGMTKHLNKISEILSEGTEIDLDALEDAEEQLKSKESEILQLDREIEDATDDLNQLEVDIESSREYRDKIILTKCKISRCFKAAQNKNKETDSRVVVTNFPANTSASIESKVQIKLPKLVIEKFGGILEHWQEFWSQFETSIHGNNILSKTEKFVYLKALLKGSALVAVQGLSVSDSNYDTAVGILRERYGRKDILVRSHLNTLLNLTPVKTAAHVRELRDLYDICEIQIRSLVSLGIELTTYGNLLFPIITKLIPDNLMLDYNRLNSTDDDSWDISKLLNFLKAEIENREKTFLFRNKSDTRPEIPTRSNFRDQNFNDRFVNKHFGFKDANVQKGTRVPGVSTGAELFSALESKDNPNKIICVFCDKTHLSSNCKSVNNLSLNEKRSLLLKKGACFKCLRTKHISRFCRTKVICSLCGNKHVDIMCWSQNDNALPDKSNEPNKGDQTSENNVLANQACQTDVQLQTLIVRMSNGNRDLLVRALIDSGSQKTYASKEIINRLGYKVLGDTKLIHTLFGGVQTREETHKKYLINVSSKDRNYKCSFEVLDQIKICNDIAKVPSGIWVKELERENIGLSDVDKSRYSKRCPVHLLIGADVAGKLLTGRIYPCPSGPVAVETKLGWTLMGKLPSRSTSPNNALFVTSLLITERLDHLWKLDVLGITDPAVSKNNKELQEETMQFFSKTVTRDASGRYEVSLPWVDPREILPSNKDIAEQRLISVKNKLTKINKLVEYDNIFKGWLKEGIIERVYDQKQEGVHYLPHRPVLKESSSTTKLRPVFDASASKRGKVSLNDCLASGPNLLEVIPSLLNRFRKNRFAVSSDIEKAFLQLSVREEDRDYLRFIWYGENKEVITYRHRRVCFGVSSSPFLLNATLIHHLSEAPQALKDTADILKESFYVDNCITSLSSVSEVEKLVVESQILLSAAQFNLRGWESNASTPVIDSFVEKKILVLGLFWDVEEDTLSCNFSNVKLETYATKRMLLSIVHSIFDPIGFTCPLTLIPKIILQETWSLKLSWDDELPERLKAQFLKWLKKLDLLSSVRIPRWLRFWPDSLENATIHIFNDASKQAYATCVFLRIECENDISVQLIQAKARVAPLKVVSIPRLELMACLIGARLAFNVIQDMGLNCILRYYWSDSVNALCWIKNNDRWATFVQNRVEEIRSLSDISEWNHIAGVENPADLPSRGCTAENLLQSRWWEGPLWLRKPKREWPKSEALPNLEIVDAEKRKSIIMTVSLDDVEEKIYERYSSYNKLLRVVAWIYRFCENARKKPEVRSVGEVTALEINKAEVTLLKLVQTDCFSGIDDKRIRGLQPMIDTEGLIRVKTRILRRKDSMNFRLPILVPPEHSLVQLMIQTKHEMLGHIGVQHLMSELREQYWILKCRKTVRKVIRNCTKCRRFNSQPLESPMAPLPEDRVKTTSVFEIIGVDLAGPLILRGGFKCWLVIYTCATYRAVHLELVTALSTENFLQSFRRFIARRGRPTIVHSDNGTNFTGAANLFKSIDWNQILAQASINRITWKFIPPSAPWWGGWWERLIGILKRILRKVLGKSSLNYEEMHTVLCDCEGLLNDRPLTYVSEDVDDLEPLTPSMFLKEVKESGVPDLDYLDSAALNKRFKYRQQIREDLRKRFRSEYLGQLRQNMKYIKGVSPIKVGDIVLIQSDNFKRINWPLAKVVQVYQGKDGYTRLAKVKTSFGEVLRAVKKLYPLEVSTVRDISDIRDALKSSSQEGSTKSIKDCENCVQTPEPEAPTVEEGVSPQTLRTRCGREIKPVRRLNL